MYIVLRKNNFSGVYTVWLLPGGKILGHSLEEAQKIKKDNEDYDILLEIFQLTPIDLCLPPNCPYNSDVRCEENRAKPCGSWCSHYPDQKTLDDWAGHE